MPNEQKTVACPTSIKMDSRKFLGALNDSAQSKVAFFEDRLRHMGNEAGKNWALSALFNKTLFFEDIDSHEYFTADHITDSGKITINNIKKIEIVENEKKELFNDSCLKLVSAIEENDQKGMQACFNRMKSQRFSSRAVPHSGMVKCRDGIVRQVVISNGELAEDTKSRLVSTIVESLRDKVIVENGNIISGCFNDGTEVKLPVTKWASRKLIARKMRDVASNAYWSEGFQNRVLNIAKLISEGKIEEAINNISPFLDKEEEFTLLTRKQIGTLVENALAAKAIFNQRLCEDTATLFHRTNLKINKDKIIKEWKNIAKNTEHPVLAENVQILSESNNFENSYNKFLELMFEAISNRQVAAEALATTLESLKVKTPKIRESHDLSSKLDNLIARLKDQNFDDAAIYEAEDLIATIQEELSAHETLGDFDSIGGLDSNPTQNAPADVSKDASGAPVININSPLIQIGGTSAAGGDAPAAPTGELDDIDIGSEDSLSADDQELDKLLAGVGDQAQPQAAPPGAAPAQGQGGSPFEGKAKKEAISESRPIHYEMKDDEDDDMPDDDCCVDESSDRYALEGDTNIGDLSVLNDYGTPVITKSADMYKIVDIMGKLAEEHELSGKKLTENLGSMAKASIKAIGLRLPDAQLTKAVEEAVEAFSRNLNEWEKPWLKDDKDGEGEKTEGHDDESDNDAGSSDNASSKPWEDTEDCDDCDVAESQHRHPRVTKSGLKKTSIAKENAKKSTKIIWEQEQQDAKLGSIAGVKFILDHGNDGDDPVILSEDGSVQLPIPKHLYNSAYASAGLSKEGDPSEFINWLYQSIEQLRPVTEDEDKAIEEAMVTIVTGPDGSTNVTVDGEVGVSQPKASAPGLPDDEGMQSPDTMDSEELADGMADEVGITDETDGPDGADEIPADNLEAIESDQETIDDGMAPVDSIDTADAEVDAEETDGIPNFENDEEDPRVFEDKDVTTPQSAKYTSTVKGDLRDMPDSKLPKKTDDELESIGPTLKKDDGTGTKSKTAKKGD